MKIADNIKILVIDRGFLEEQTEYEDSFLSYLWVNIDNYAEDFYRRTGLHIEIDTISVMDEIIKGKIFKYLKDESKIKKAKQKLFDSIDETFPKYTTYFSSDCIDNMTKDTIKCVHIFVVYTESDAEIAMLNRKFGVDTILRFTDKASNAETPVKENINKLYIHNMKSVVIMSKTIIGRLMYAIDPDVLRSK